MKRVCLGLLVIVIVALPGMAQSQPVDNSDAFLGEVFKDAYSNAYFGFRLKRPTGMYVLSEEQKSTYKAAGVDLLRAPDANMDKAAWEKAATAEVVIFSLAEKEPGSAPTASLNIGALRQGAGVTSKMVCEVTRDFLAQNPKLTVQTDVRPITLAGKAGSQLDFVMSGGPQQFFVRYYALIVRGHSLTFVITYMKDEELNRFETILKSLEFFR